MSNDNNHDNIATTNTNSDNDNDTSSDTSNSNNNHDNHNNHHNHDPADPRSVAVPEGGDLRGSSIPKVVEDWDRDFEVSIRATFISYWGGGARGGGFLWGGLWTNMNFEVVSWMGPHSSDPALEDGGYGEVMRSASRSGISWGPDATHDASDSELSGTTWDWHHSNSGRMSQWSDYNCEILPHGDPLRHRIWGIPKRGGLQTASRALAGFMQCTLFQMCCVHLMTWLYALSCYAMLYISCVYTVYIHVYIYIYIEREI